MTDYSPTLYTTILDIVNGGYFTFQGYANQAFNLSVNAASALKSAEFSFVPVSVDYSANASAGSFVAPPTPDANIDALELPSARPEFSPGSLAKFTPKVPPPEPQNLGAQYIVPGGKPGALSVTRPGAAPAIADIEIPEDLSDYTLPPVPTLIDLGVVADPVINEVAFQGVRPEAPDVPVIPFAFAEQAYSSTLADAVKASLAGIIAGDETNLGLPAHVLQQVYERGREREAQSALRARQEVMDEFADRGFVEPPGIMAKRLLQLTQGAQSAANTFNRETVIRDHEVRIEQYRFAITNAIGLEQTLIQAHLATEQRRFEAARFLFESLLQVFNARVALYNGEVQAYQADAQVFRDRIQAELVKVEIFRGQVEAQRVRGELNRTLVEQYVAQVRAIREQADAYRARVEAARVRSEIEGLKLERYRTEVQAFGEGVRAYAAEWEGYGRAVQAELGKVQAAEALARVYATRVQAWEVGERTSLESVRIDYQLEETRVRAFQAELQGWVAHVEALSSRIQAQAQAVTAAGSIYAAAGQMAIAESNKLDRAVELAVNKGNAEAQIRLENARTNLQASLQASGYYLQALQTVAQTTTQLAGSSLSAINISGGVSGSVGQSFGYSLGKSKSWGWNGEVETQIPDSF